MPAVLVAGPIVSPFSSPAVAVPSPVLILPNNGGMARLSWPEWTWIVD